MFTLCVSADQDSNAFAYRPTTSSFKLSWDALNDLKKRKRHRRSEDSVVQINIQAQFMRSNLTDALFSAEQLQGLFVNKTISVSSGTLLQGLQSGSSYNVAITGLNDQGLPIENKALNTSAVTGESHKFQLIPTLALYLLKFIERNVHQ